MLEAATQLVRARRVQFVIAVAPTIDRLRIERELREDYAARAKRATIRTIAGATYGALRHSDVAVVASGTATVEAALLERPMVVVYRVAPLTGFLARFMVSVPHYSMVNLLAGKAVVPELIQGDFTADKVAEQVGYLLDHAEARETMKADLRTLKSHLGPGGAIERAADAVVRMIEPSRASVSASFFESTAGTGYN